MITHILCVGCCVRCTWTFLFQLVFYFEHISVVRIIFLVHDTITDSFRGHNGCFQCETIINNVHVSCTHGCIHIYLREWKCWVKWYKHALISKIMLNYFLKSLNPVIFLPAINKKSSWSPFSPTLGIVRLLNFFVYKMVSHSGLIS